MRKIIEREAPEKLIVKMWLYPYLTWATAALIVFVLGYMLTDTEHDGRETVLLSLLVAAVVLAIAVVKEKLGGGRGADAHAVAHTEAERAEVDA
jgi:GABA permease